MRIPVNTMTSSSSASLQVMEESKDEMGAANDTQHGGANSQGNTFDFDKCYLTFTGDSNEKIRQITAASIHEGFVAAQDSEDTSSLREAFHELMTDEVTEVLISLIPNLPTTIKNYANKHAVENFN
jgi:hypothetical protein